MTTSEGRAVSLPRASAVERSGRLAGALWPVTLAWIAARCTVFPLGDGALEAVSVFTFDRLAFLFVGALLVARVVRDPPVLRRTGRVEAAMAVYLAVIGLSWATTLRDKTAVDLKRDVELLSTCFVMPFAAFLIARHGGWTARQARAGMVVLVVSVGVFLVALGVVQALVDWRFLIEQPERSFHQTRARGPFDNALPYSLLLGLLVPTAIALAASERRRRRILWLVLCAGLIEGLVLAQMRIVWIALPVALLYFAAVSPPVRRFATIAAMAMVAAVALAKSGLDLHSLAAPDGALSQPGAAVDVRIRDEEPIYNRVAVYATALNMIAHRPLFGFGFGAHTFEQWRDPYYTSCCGVPAVWAEGCAVPHNELLNALVLLGAVGLAVYLALLRELWRLLSSARATLDGRAATLAAATQSCFVLLVIAGQLHDMMYQSQALVLFFFVAGLAAPARAREDD